MELLLRILLGVVAARNRLLRPLNPFFKAIKYINYLENDFPHNLIVPSVPVSDLMDDKLVILLLRLGLEL